MEDYIKQAIGGGLAVFVLVSCIATLSMVSYPAGEEFGVNQLIYILVFALIITGIGVGAMIINGKEMKQVGDERKEFVQSYGFKLDDEGYAEVAGKLVYYNDIYDELKTLSEIETETEIESEIQYQFEKKEQERDEIKE